MKLLELFDKLAPHTFVWVVTEEEWKNYGDYGTALYFDEFDRIPRYDVKETEIVQIYPEYYASVARSGISIIVK